MPYKRKRKIWRYRRIITLVVLLLGFGYILWRAINRNEDSHDQLLHNFTAQISIDEITDTQYLKLVNRDHSIAIPVCEIRLTTLWPYIPTRDQDILIHESAWGAMMALYYFAERDGLDTLFVASGFRTSSQQQTIYENAADSRYVMPPGHSEHQLGLAIDILILGRYDTASMFGSFEAGWLADKAPQYGLILRYPYSKEHITGVPYEPWHFRYVGRVHAWIMGQHEIVLEEYIRLLQDNIVYRTEFDGRAYHIVYQKPYNGTIAVPESMEFSISSANTGGYVVTAWDR